MSELLVVIIGRPNVGKSTLFNKITGKKLSIVEGKPGVTRDRLYSEAEWCGRFFTVIDTGGMDTVSNDQMLKHIRNQANIAIESCDVIIFVLDARAGITSEDTELANILRKSGKKVIVAANKADNPQSFDIYEFYNLGLGEVFAISAASGNGVAELLDEVVKNISRTQNTDSEDIINIAVVGRPNAGKSSLVNRLLGYERTIVSENAGTTRDAIDTHITVEQKKYNIIDTAGIRRKRSIDENVEYYSVLRALYAIKRADVCLVVIDSEQGVSEQDVRVCGYIHDEGKPSVIVMNKWDKIEKDGKTTSRFENDLAEKLKFMDYYKSIYISALTGKRADKIFPLIDYVYEKSCFSITTGTLNEVISDAVSISPPPSRKGKKLNIFYATQVGQKPPSFVIFVNDFNLMHFSYKRYLENSLRNAFTLDGTPIRLFIRNRERDKS